MQVNIRQWRLSDAEDLAEALNDPSVLNNLRDGLPYPYTVSDAEEFISAMLSANRNDVFAFAITADGKTVGSIGVFRQGNIHCRTAETGVATAAVRKACEYVFENSDIIRIFAEPFADNAASCRVLEKSGFTQEGVLKCNAVKNGKIMDMKMYSLIKPSLD